VRRWRSKELEQSAPEQTLASGSSGANTDLYPICPVGTGYLADGAALKVADRPLVDGHGTKLAAAKVTLAHPITVCCQGVARGPP
jgi:hypothetical protein